MLIRSRDKLNSDGERKYKEIKDECLSAAVFISAGAEE